MGCLFVLTPPWMRLGEPSLWAHLVMARTCPLQGHTLCIHLPPSHIHTGDTEGLVPGRTLGVWLSV